MSSVNENESEYLNTRQVAEMLNISIATVYRWKSGVGVTVPLPCIKMSRRKIMYERAEVCDWIDMMKGTEEDLD